MPPRLPPMQALRAFEATARTLSLTRAGAELHLTHSAISHQIKALEARLGCRLFERVARGVRLTDEGERFAARVRAALDEIADAAREITARNSPRRLKITVMPSFAARWLLPRIGRFLRRHPEIDLEISASLALVDFAREDVDVALRYGQGGWPGLIAERVFEDRYFPVASPRFNGGRLPKRPADLGRHLLLRSDNEYWRPWFVAAGADLPEPVRGPMFNDSSLMLEAAIDGQGIALARSSLVTADLREGRLVRLFDHSIASPNAYYLVHPPRLAGTPKLAAFRTWLLEEIAATADPDRAAGVAPDRPASSAPDVPDTNPPEQPAGAASARRDPSGAARIRARPRRRPA